jgi:hypothetical protein
MALEAKVNIISQIHELFEREIKSKWDFPPEGNGRAGRHKLHAPWIKTEKGNRRLMLYILEFEKTWGRLPPEELDFKFYGPEVPQKRRGSDDFQRWRRAIKEITGNTKKQ